MYLLYHVKENRLKTKGVGYNSLSGVLTCTNQVAEPVILYEKPAKLTMYFYHKGCELLPFKINYIEEDLKKLWWVRVFVVSTQIFKHFKTHIP